MRTFAVTEDRGFGLIEAIISVTILGVISAVGVKVAESIARNGKIAGASAEASLIKSQINTILSADSNTCLKALQDSAGSTAKFNPDIKLPPNPKAEEVAAFKAANTLVQLKLGSLLFAKPGEKAGNLLFKK